MAHQYIIFGLPDSILMLCMHLDTPHEMFSYLENRYGPIPRPESLKAVEKAMPQCDTQPEQDAAGETAQDTCNSNDEPEYSPGSQGEPVYSPSDCAEIMKGHLEPETEIIDAQQVDYLPMVEVGAADSEVLDECTNALDAPVPGRHFTQSQRHKRSYSPPSATRFSPLQWASDEAAESRDLPELSSKTLDSVGNTIGQAGVRLQMPIEDTRCLSMDDETIANVPDPPTTHYELATSQIECPTQTRSATSTNFILPVSEPTPKEPDELEGGDRNDDVDTPTRTESGNQC
ncbi:hypothetical protein EDD15DRAFT_2374848 [Pisolithus albus]|nr:hypothetical protein EDD15DRAFT_2374848 [Pisolithus albus]